MRTARINNQLVINAIDAARENLRIYNRTVDALTDFSSNAAKAWISLFSTQQPQQQQFFIKYSSSQLQNNILSNSKAK